MDKFRSFLFHTMGEKSYICTHEKTNNDIDNKTKPMKTKIFALAALLCAWAAQAAAAEKVDRPRLVVGVVVDQMRWDYLYRYYDQFAEGGLKRLLKEGYNFDNMHYNYLPTVTAAGHASIYTGTTPAIHGIAGNNYHLNGRPIYCVEDTTVAGVGTTSKAGKMSPRNMMVTNMCDQLRLATDFRSKVIGVALKDRASILPAGHSANAAYWFDRSTGTFITSTYYMDELPAWVRSFNKDNKTNPKEDIWILPKGLSLTTKMAIAALDGEKLGRQADQTDMLCISYSSTDVMGHKYGTRGPKTDEMYLALDKELRKLFDVLDSRIGRDKYLLFITADHAGGHNAKFLNDHKLPGGQLGYWGKLKKELSRTLAARFAGVDVIDDVNGEQVYLNLAAIKQRGLNLDEVEQAVCDEIQKYEGVQYVVPVRHLMTTTIPYPIRDRILMGNCPRRSGEIQIVPRPAYYDYSYNEGTSHSHWAPYDTHVPFILMGWHIDDGHTNRLVNITDIAPTICALLKIQMPSGCVGTPLLD